MKRIVWVPKNFFSNSKIKHDDVEVVMKKDIDREKKELVRFLRRSFRTFDIVVPKIFQDRHSLLEQVEAMTSWFRKFKKEFEEILGEDLD